IWILFAYLILVDLQETGANYLVCLGKIKRAALLPMAGRAFYLVALILMLAGVFTASVFSVVCCLAVTVVVPVLIIWASLIPHLGFEFDAALLSQMLRFSSPFILGSSSDRVIRHVDEFVVAAAMGNEAVAMYGLAYLIMNYACIFAHTISKILHPAFQEWVVKGKRHAEESFFKIVAPQVSFFWMILISLSMLLAGVAINILNENYIEVEPVLQLLLFAAGMAMAGNLIFACFPAHDLTLAPMLVYALCGIANAGLDISLVGTYGLYAAAGATLFAYFLRMASFAIIADRKLGLRDACRVLPPLGVGVGALLICLFVDGLPLRSAAVGAWLLASLLLAARLGLFSPDTPDVLRNVNMPDFARKAMSRFYASRD
ncbi:MAG: oligosaccharide flippase family protein, partial [Planctomycetes bacterium]|nr:oligosaccharide flippase family protein [Planctomycetota bacterium]